MSDDGLLSADRVARMHDAFDRSFAEARQPDPPAAENLLAIRIGLEPYALRLSEVAGLFAARKIIPLPDGAPALLGIAGFRGAIVPVYDLHVLLGHPAAETVRWLAIVAGAPLSVAFAAVDGHLRIPLDAIVPHERGEDPRRHVRDLARTPDLVRPIVHLPSVVDAVRRLVPANLNTEGR